MNSILATALFWIGIGQLSVLVASSLVPVQLNWKKVLRELPLLIRQLFWVYGGYVVLSIISLGCICLLTAEELSSGSGLARAFCMYGAAFWGIRLILQLVLAAKPHLTTRWLRCGYHLLTILFAWFTLIFSWAAFH